MSERPRLVEVGLDEVADGAEAALEGGREVAGGSAAGGGGRGRRRRRGRQVEAELELVQPVRQRVAVPLRGGDGRVGVRNQVSAQSCSTSHHVIYIQSGFW